MGAHVREDLRRTRRKLKLLSNPENLNILRLLHGSPTYTRRLSVLTGISESHLCERLRGMEKWGILKGERATQGGRRVKVYSLTSEAFEVALGRPRIHAGPERRKKGTCSEDHAR